MKTDIEIAREVQPLPIADIANRLGIADDDLELYGKYKAKINVPSDPKLKGKLILVTAINPTPFGEGKTTVSIGLADGMKQLNANVCLALREPSLGPVFGIKGGATGGGRAQVIPMEDINLHFTGDFHAITSANNLLSALIDNHIKQGNILNIDPERVVWKRAMDMNDRALRVVTVAEGGVINGTPRADGFTITSASETMAILCLSKNIMDLKRRLSQILVAYDRDGNEISAAQLTAHEAMAILLKEALKPNLVQTLEGTPAIIHGGPFANIAHGCNSVIATKAALSYADYVITEAGFGAELGAEKFLDIKCRAAGLTPSAMVLVATCRSLKYNGGVDKANISKPDLDALNRGMVNLIGHIRNLKTVFNQTVIVAVNRFVTDSDDELNAICQAAKTEGATAVITEGWEKGGAGCTLLAKAVMDATNQTLQPLTFCYPENTEIQNKIIAVATKVYGAGAVEFSDTATKKIAELNRTSYRHYPVCIAKTQYSFSQDMKLLGRPTGFTFTVRDIELRAGAEFIVAICGDVMLMPGLPKIPAANNMTLTDDGIVSGLF